VEFWVGSTEPSVLLSELVKMRVKKKKLLIPWYKTLKTRFYETEFPYLMARNLTLILQ